MGITSRETVLRFRSLLASVFEEMEDMNFIYRLERKDPLLWKASEEHKAIIRNSLGWIDVPELMLGRAGELTEFARSVRDDGVTHVVVLGMGGSSLAPLVFKETFMGCSETDGFPELLVLDSTDPGTVSAVASKINLLTTLFIVASKSGTTIEPMSFFAYFYDLLKEQKGENAGENFIAITDPGTRLEALATEKGFRKTFLNPPDIGGRFSALSYFGLVPAALMGVDIEKLLQAAITTKAECLPKGGGGEEGNPAFMLGASLGSLAYCGKNKLTFLLNGQISAFGLWLEQLIAESTGKEGRGLVPISGEPLLPIEDYGFDRVFVRIALAGEQNAEMDERCAALERTGHTVFRYDLEDRYELAGEFYRWELATAICGAVLGINPFDQPDVEDAKVRARQCLNGGGRGGGDGDKDGELIKAAHYECDAFSITFGRGTFESLGLASVNGAEKENEIIPKILKSFFSPVSAVAFGEGGGKGGGGGYACVLAYLNSEDALVSAALKSLRACLGDVFKVATQFGYGPRYLHSTGQLHKGGPEGGIFLILVTDERARGDVAIPGSDFSFAGLEMAQALGDMSALDANGRSVALVRLKSPVSASLGELTSTLGRIVN